jgi:hypothetical protein
VDPDGGQFNNRRRQNPHGGSYGAIELCWWAERGLLGPPDSDDWWQLGRLKQFNGQAVGVGDLAVSKLSSLHLGQEKWVPQARRELPLPTSRSTAHLVSVEQIIIDLGLASPLQTIC